MGKKRNNMNKLMGFYELNSLNLPTIQWKEYTGNETLNPNFLWTVRSAVFNGNDLNLPRTVGVKADDATSFATHLLYQMKDEGIVIYYPYFIANKSGTLNIYKDQFIIEAVRNDLWNLVTHSDREVTYIIKDDEITFDGNENFLSKNELKCISSNVPTIRRSFRNDLLEGKSILLEWSLAQKSDLEKAPTGEEFLVFYELRTV